MVGRLACRDTDDADDELHDDHASGAIQEDGAAAEALDDVK